MKANMAISIELHPNSDKIIMTPGKFIIFKWLIGHWMAFLDQ